MKILFKFIIIVCFIYICCFNNAFANADVFNNKVSADSIQIPQFKDVSCNFEQEKYIPNSNQTIKSGGTFQFILRKGVIFNTEYPVKYTTSYTSKENKYVNDIIVGISKKEFSYVEKNFDLFFKNNNSKWILGLVPKSDSPSKVQLKNIIIIGKDNIDEILINTVNNGSTKIKFMQCK